MRFIWVILCLMAVYFTFTNQMMISMYLMVGIMLAESLVNVINPIIKKNGR